MLSFERLKQLKKRPGKQTEELSSADDEESDAGSDAGSEVDNKSDSEKLQSDNESDEAEFVGQKKISSRKRRKWFQAAWPVEKFNADAKEGKKAEWIKFRDQFTRVLASKGAATDEMKITAMHIYAGDYLMKAIAMVKMNKKVRRFKKLVKALDCYFSGTVDRESERIKFADMQQGEEEVFTEWALRLQQQLVLCEFKENRQEEEMRMALMRRSKKSSSLTRNFGKDLNRFLNHGSLLDHMSRSGKKESELLEEKPVNAVKAEFNREAGRQSSRFVPYESKGYRAGREEAGGSKQFGPRKWIPARQGLSGGNVSRRECGQCGVTHGALPCRAKMSECFKCNKIGHFARMCRMTTHRGEGGAWEKRKEMSTEMARRVNKVKEDNGGKTEREGELNLNPLFREEDSE